MDSDDDLMAGIARISSLKKCTILKLILTETIDFMIRFHSLSEAAVQDTAFHLACWYKWALFGNDRRVGRDYGTCVGRCNTCCLQHEHESVCYVLELLG